MEKSNYLTIMRKVVLYKYDDSLYINPQVKEDVFLGEICPPFYASNAPFGQMQPRFVPARDFGKCRDNVRNSQSEEL